MGPKEFALRTGKPEKTISAVLGGTSSITPDMALQFEPVTRIPTSFWMNHQQSYDEYLARLRRDVAIDDAATWAKKFPLADMIKKGWIPPVSAIRDKTTEMLTFFGFSTHLAWEDYYFKQQLKVAFRISLKHTKEPYAISAWLRKGELQAADLRASIYSEKKFKEALPEIKSLMAKHPVGFFTQLQNICLGAGVKVVHTPCISKAPINGATRWLNETPFIQLSGRYNRNDSFWFTFFHEAGHILLHGKKDIFLEEVEYSDIDKQKETEADEFATRWTLTEDEEATVLEAAPRTEEVIKSFAKKFNTHPAIITGRLQIKKAIPYSLGRTFLQSVIFD